MQRDGIHVRMYSLVPGETVPCAVFPGDDLVVAALRADFSGVDAVTLTVSEPGDALGGEIDDVPVSGPDGEVAVDALLHTITTHRGSETSRHMWQA